MSDKGNVFGERLRLLRSVRGNISQKDFAHEMGIPQPTLSSYESGKINPTVDAVINIAEKCGVSMDWLCGRDQTLRLKSMGDVLACFFDLYETNEFAFKTTFHDRVDIEENDAEKDEERNWISLQVYHNEGRRNPDLTLNGDLCAVIERAYRLTQKLARYELSQDMYDHEKQRSIDTYSKFPISKIDHSDISEDEQHRLMLGIMKEEWEAWGKKQD